MIQNWQRHFEIQLLDDNGKGISLSDFKVTFDIEWFNIKFSRVATVKKFTTSETNSRILGSEFSKIKIIAGYDGIASKVDTGLASQQPSILPRWARPTARTLRNL